MEEIVLPREIKALVVDVCYSTCGPVFQAEKERCVIGNWRRNMPCIDSATGDFSAQEAELNRIGGRRSLSNEQTVEVPVVLASSLRGWQPHELWRSLQR